MGTISRYIPEIMMYFHRQRIRAVEERARESTNSGTGKIRDSDEVIDISSVQDPLRSLINILQNPDHPHRTEVRDTLQQVDYK